MYKCNVCGAEFETPREVTEREREEDGFIHVWVDSLCPSCGDDDFDEVEECTECGQLCAELYNGICEDCLTELAYDSDTVWFYGQDNKVSRDINGVVSWLLDNDEDFEAYLLKYFDKAEAYEKAEYCLQDKYEFSNFINRRSKK